MENVGREMSRVKSLVTPPLGSKIPQVRSTPLKKVSDIREKLERERTFTVESTPESSPKLKQSPQKNCSGNAFEKIHTCDSHAALLPVAIMTSWTMILIVYEQNIGSDGDDTDNDNNAEDDCQR